MRTIPMPSPWLSERKKYFDIKKKIMEQRV